MKWIKTKDYWPDQHERVIAYTPTDIPSMEYRIVPPGEFGKFKDSTYWTRLLPPEE